MERQEVEALRARVGCSALLTSVGFSMDRKGSTRRAMKYRRADETLIVIHDDRGWFDVHSDAKGDVFALASHLMGSGFAASLEIVAGLVGLPLLEESWERSAPKNVSCSIAARWVHRPKPFRMSKAGCFLTQLRALPWRTVSAAIGFGLLREGPFGSVWAGHSDAEGAVIGWEERGPDWRGFAAGGSKELFRFGLSSASRICVTEAAIDAMSLAALENLRTDTLYVSTGGGWAPRTQSALERYADQANIRLVAATDANIQGDLYADRIRRMAASRGCDFSRLRPEAEDWNDELKGAKG